MLFLSIFVSLPQYLSNSQKHPIIHPSLHPKIPFGTWRLSSQRVSGPRFPFLDDLAFRVSILPTLQVWFLMGLQWLSLPDTAGTLDHRHRHPQGVWARAVSLAVPLLGKRKVRKDRSRQKTGLKPGISMCPPVSIGFLRRCAR